MTRSRLAAIAIGRNEGTRLRACLASLAATGSFDRIVYVDSGSTDGSIDMAMGTGAEVVTLDADAPFTAARARNAGLARLAEGPAPDLVQFIDGDCTLDPDWLPAALNFLTVHPDVAVVCGRRRERFPQASVYNRLCDDEWNTPVGEARACGGDALMRRTALDAVGGYDSTLIAGEEPEMCLRMRRHGWAIWRLDIEMTLHDANITRFSQFWARMRRGGFASAEAAAMYGREPERHGVAGLYKAAVWGLALPLAILLGALVVGPATFWLLLIYPAQTARLALRRGGGRFAWEWAALLTIGKFAEARGVLDYLLRRLRRGPAQLIEYK
jgi:GT2 family glycosyltransferase